MGFETGAELPRKWVCQHFLLGRKGGGQHFMGTAKWEDLFSNENRRYFV